MISNAFKNVAAISIETKHDLPILSSLSASAP